MRKPTVTYLKEQKCTHIETHNCIVNIKHDVTDRLGRAVTVIEVLPDKYAGEPKKKLIGNAYTKVITLKKK